MSHTFDPTAFVQAVSLLESTSTIRQPVAVGEYPATVEGWSAETWQTATGDKTGLKLVVTWTIDSEEVKRHMQRQKVICRQQIFLDLNETTDGLATGPGQNIGLGLLRQGLSLNQPGREFKLDDIVGHSGTVMVTHRPGKDGRVYDEVSRVVQPTDSIPVY